MKKKEPVWIDEREVLAIYDRLLALNGGAAGVRDHGLLQSALARPRQHHPYGGTSDIITMAAIYSAGIARNHPFIDGNKRAAFVVGILFLELNGISFKASEADATRAVLDLAAGAIDEEAYETWLRTNVSRRAR